MKLGHYRNKPLDEILKVPHDRLQYYLESQVVEEVYFRKPQQVISIDATNYVMYCGQKQYPIGISNNNTHYGAFVVVEKWEYPYWKGNSLAFLPSEQNPIGKYLIILAEKETLRKVPVGIHAWPHMPFASTGFRQGNRGTGCVRVRPEDMESVFNGIQLNSVVHIYC